MSSAFSMYQAIRVMFQEYLVKMYLARVLRKQLRLLLDREILEGASSHQIFDSKQPKGKSSMRRNLEESVFI